MLAAWLSGEPGLSVASPSVTWLQTDTTQCVKRFRWNLVAFLEPWLLTLCSFFSNYFHHPSVFTHRHRQAPYWHIYISCMNTNVIRWATKNKPVNKIKYLCCLKSLPLLFFGPGGAGRQECKRYPCSHQLAIFSVICLPDVSENCWDGMKPDVSLRPPGWSVCQQTPTRSLGIGVTPQS